MTRVCVANIESDFHNAFLCFAEHASRSVHPKIRVVAGRRLSSGIFEKAKEVKLAQAGL